VADFVSPSLLVQPLRHDLNMRALETLGARVSSLDISPAVLYDFDTVDLSALTHLAEQFNVLGDAGWDMANTEAKKRALLKEAVALHRIKGTPYAVKRSLELLGVNASLTEWFQTAPKGIPHTFALNANVTDQQPGAVAIDAARADQIKRMVSFWKPARSHFTLTVGVGFSTDLRVAAIFSGTQCLISSGSLLALEVIGSTDMRAAGIFSNVQLLTSGGFIRA
jgi:phage tail P2-like protein